MNLKDKSKKQLVQMLYEIDRYPETTPELKAEKDEAYQSVCIEFERRRNAITIVLLIIASAAGVVAIVISLVRLLR